MNSKNVATVVLDKIDIKIISLLQKNGRMTKLQLSEKVALSATPCWERMKKLERKGIITGYSAEIDIDKLITYSMSRVKITLKDYTVAKASEFEKIVNSIPEIIECEAVLGHIDYILKIYSSDVDEYQKTIERLLNSSKFEIEHRTLPISKTIKKLDQIHIQDIL
ncbi:MAG: Lrp/AsnC family transcriptional regulator of ectoine degradation [Paraglaciecola sp.]|jgi:Lrp/AsnC family transcriptional regulator of ectoine degradation